MYIFSHSRFSLHLPYFLFLFIVFFIIKKEFLIFLFSLFLSRWNSNRSCSRVRRKLKLCQCFFFPIAFRTAQYYSTNWFLSWWWWHQRYETSNVWILHIHVKARYWFQDALRVIMWMVPLKKIYIHSLLAKLHIGCFANETKK